MSEIKPCMNTECPYCSDKAAYVYGCRVDQPKECPKYRDTPPPAPLEPLNPDDYEPGCTNSECKYHYGAHKDFTNCSLMSGRPTSFGHRALCECVPCYRPPKKPKTQLFAVIKVPIEPGDKVRVTVNESTDIKWYNLNKGKCELLAEAECEVIEVPVKHA